MSILFKNFKIIRHGDTAPFSDILVENGKISMTGTGLNGDEIIDGGNRLWLSAAFIDIHTHGGGGYDFMDADPEEYVRIAENHARHGAGSLYPTTISASQQELNASISAFRESRELNIGRGAKMQGMHLEGPYISKEQRGAMDEKYIRLPEPSEYIQMFENGDVIRRMTIAPEIEGTLELGRYMKSHGIIPSIGHTDALCKEVQRAYHEGGYSLMTHLYSGMNMTKRIDAWRHAGAVEAAYLLDGMFVEIIADGCHLPPELLSLVYKIKGEDHTILVTDSMRAAGMDEGIYRFGSRKNGYDVIVEDGVAKLMNRSAFAGSVATTDRLVRTMVTKVNVPIPKAVKMITETPASAMGISDTGVLDVGKCADITVFDDEINILITMVDGKIVYTI